MANPFFNAFGGGNIIQMLGQIRTNPMAFLQKAGFNVPAGVDLTNPQGIIQHLMNSGQITQQQMNQAQMMAQNFR